MPIFVGRQFLRIEPDRPPGSLSHLGAGGRRDQRGCQAEQRFPRRPPPEFHPGDDIAPLVGPADLQLAAEPARQLDKIVGLQDRIVEFQKAERLVALEPKPDAVLGQHPVDREMPPDIAQQGDVTQLVEPVGIVDHHGVAGAIAEMQELCEDRADARHVAGDLGIIEQLACFVLAGRIADPRRSPAHQDDRLVAILLEEAQQHDRHQAADMQAVRRAIIADIGDEPSGGQPLAERFSSVH